ncbi:MFS transporter [Thermoplasmatales archaeon SW_10_69_26]|nr:MAG: MFS transporter [Thermoplasmatales archaeon SW_10_69_26]
MVASGSVVTGTLVDQTGWVAAVGLLVALLALASLLLVVGLIRDEL